MSSVATAEAQPDVLKALRSLGGRGTLGDVVSSVGLPRDEVEDTLKSLLESRQGHLEVSDSGEVVYLFDRKLIRRDRVSTIQRLKSTAKRVLTGAFKAWIVTMLVVYFVCLRDPRRSGSRGDDVQGRGPPKWRQLGARRGPAWRTL